MVIAYMITVLLLIAAVLFLAAKLRLVKRQLKEIKKQMEEQAEGFISVDFVDRDVEAVALKINEKLDELQRVRAEAVKSEQAVKASVSMISHDMRTPLTSVIGYLQLARRSCREEDVLRNINIALERAEYSGRLIDDFFELSVIDSDCFTPVMERVNICEVVCEEILANYPEFEKRGLTPLFGQADDEVRVWADRKLLARVTLSVSNSMLETISRAVDTGKIFDRFYRADASRSSGGAGLGLYICRRLIEGMNGSIGASCSDKMLTVKVELVSA